MGLWSVCLTVSLSVSSRGALRATVLLLIPEFAVVRLCSLLQYFPIAHMLEVYGGEGQFGGTCADSVGRQVSPPLSQTRGSRRPKREEALR